MSVRMTFRNGSIVTYLSAHNVRCYPDETLRIFGRYEPGYVSQAIAVLDLKDVKEAKDD